MAVNKVVKSDGTTLIDITGTTATASDVASGKTFFTADGTETTGTVSGATQIETPEIVSGSWASGGPSDGGNRGRTSVLIRPTGKVSFGLGDYSTYKFGYLIYTSDDLSTYTNSGWVTEDVTNLEISGYAIGFTFAYLSGSGAISSDALEEIRSLFSISVSGSIETASLATKTITANGTYTAISDYVDGYSSVTVNASSWTKIAETSYTVSTTSTSTATVATWGTGDSSIWTSDKILYVRIRDTAGPRAGYFYGSDNFIVNITPANSSSSTSYTNAIRAAYSYTSDGLYALYTGGYGVYTDTIYSDGRIRIRSRYNSSYSRTIDGTYSVEVYLLTPPSAIFT